jgi:HSP20 family protein
MAFNGNLIPWRWHRQSVPARREDGEWSGFNSVQQEMNRVFEDFFTGFQWPMPVGEGKNVFDPRLDVTETEKELSITVELPGMDEKDIDLSLSNNALTIKGEKKEEKENRTHGHYRIERTYGSFQRTIPVPCEIESDKVEATFKKGVLSITLPKNQQEKCAGKKINIKLE